MAGITRKVWTSARIYMRLNRWAKSGVPERVFWALQAEGLLGWRYFLWIRRQSRCIRTRTEHQKKRETGDREESWGLEYEDKRVGGERPGGCGVQFIARERG
jgi:hypothetical protein